MGMKATQSFTSDAGKVFQTAEEAWRDDLYHKLYPAILNEAVTHAAVRAICDDLKGFRMIIDGLGLTPPVPPLETISVREAIRHNIPSGYAQKHGQY